MTTVSDDFNRAEASSLGANWTNTGSTTIGVRSNQCYFGDSWGAGEQHRMRYTATALSGVDQYVEFDITTLPSTGYGDARIMARFSSATSAYEFRRDNAGSWYVNRITSGGETDIVSGSAGTFSATETWRMEVSGSGATVSIAVYKDGVQQGSTYSDTDASRITTGTTVGIGGYTASGSPSDVFMDNWAGGDLGAAATSYPPAWRRRTFAHLLGR